MINPEDIINQLKEQLEQLSKKEELSYLQKLKDSLNGRKHWYESNSPAKLMYCVLWHAIQIYATSSNRRFLVRKLNGLPLNDLLTLTGPNPHQPQGYLHWRRFLRNLSPTIDLACRKIKHANTLQQLRNIQKKFGLNFLNNVLFDMSIKRAFNIVMAPRQQELTQAEQAYAQRAAAFQGMPSSVVSLPQRYLSDPRIEKNNIHGIHYMYDPSNPHTLHYANIACSIETKTKFQSTKDVFFEQLNRMPLQALNAADVKVFEGCLDALDSDAIEKYVAKNPAKLW